MAGTVAYKNKLYKKILDVTDAAKTGILTGTLEKKEAKVQLSLLSELDQAYIKISQSVLTHYDTWNYVDKKVKLDIERSKVAELVARAQKSLADHLAEQDGLVKDMADMSHALGLDGYDSTEAEEEEDPSKIEPSSDTTVIDTREFRSPSRSHGYDDESEKGKLSEAAGYQVVDQVSPAYGTSLYNVTRAEQEAEIMQAELRKLRKREEEIRHSLANLSLGETTIRDSNQTVIPAPVQKRQLSSTRPQYSSTPSGGDDGDNFSEYDEEGRGDRESACGEDRYKPLPQYPASSRAETDDDDKEQEPRRSETFKELPRDNRITRQRELLRAQLGDSEKEDILLQERPYSRHLPSQERYSGYDRRLMPEENFCSRTPGRRPQGKSQSYPPGHEVNARDFVSSDHVINKKESDGGVSLHGVDNLHQDNSRQIPGQSQRPSNPYQQAMYQQGYNTTVDDINQSSWSKYFAKIPLPTFNGSKRQFEGWWQTFAVCVDNFDAPPELKLLRLKQCLVGDPAEEIESLGFSAAAYEIAKERLHRLYGGERRRLTMRLDALDSIKSVRDEHPEDLEKFASMLDKLVINLLDQNQGGELGQGTLYLTIKKKLNEALLRRYERWLHSTGKQGDVLTLRQFINDESYFQMIAAETIKGLGKDKKKSELSDKKDATKKKTLTSNASAGSQRDQSASGKRKLSCRLCKKDHGIWKCKEFTGLSVKQRRTKAYELKLCTKCLSGMHGTTDCYRKKTCFIEGCQRQNHHTLLHDENKFVTRQPTVSSSPANEAPPEKDPATNESETKSSAENSEPSKGDSTSQKTTMMTSSGGCISFRTVPVLLHHQGKKLLVNAVLDDASNQSYISERVANELNLPGEYYDLEVHVIDDKVSTGRSRDVTCILTDQYEEKVTKVFTAKTLKRITPGIETLDWNTVSNKYSHLKDIPFPQPAAGDIEVLIGLDHLSLMTGEQHGDIKGLDGEPVARLTPLGWTCVGHFPGDSAPFTFITAAKRPSDNMTDMIRKFWEVEEPGTKRAYTKEEQAALDIVKNSIRRERGRYAVKIPWKQGRPKYMNNYQSAFSRLRGTERKLSKNPKLSKNYQGVFDKQQQNNYFRKVKGANPKTDNANYLAHFPVVRDHVATTKTRIVYDGSAEDAGVCINDLIHQGPKLQQSLIKVLTRFRRYRVAITCDIQEMYLQIIVYEEDRPFQRFLWRNMQTDTEPEVYEFDRVVFGLNTSPFLAQYVARHNADVCQEKYPRAAETIKESTYMDDSLDSEKSDEQGIQLVKDIKAVWNHASMNARKWLSNSVKVMETIPEEDRAADVDLTKHELPSGSTLGQGWEAQTDKLTFKSAPKPDVFPTTKRGYLKILATVFDPLGLASPVIVRGRMILQEMWLHGLDWDDLLPDSLQNKVEAWIKDVSNLPTYDVPRCLMPYGDLEDGVDMYLVTCTDSSDDAYGAICYVWNRSSEGDIYINIAISKARVTPIHSVSTPKKELLGAVVGVNLAEEMGDILKIPIERRMFFSDSRDVLYWVRGHAREFKPFVEHRVGEIQSKSNPENWQYVNTKDNPADLLSRGCSTEVLKDSKLWRYGPSFLQDDPSTWPKEDFTSGQATLERKKSSMKLCRSMFTKTGRSLLGCNLKDTRLDPKRHSSLRKLVNTTAYVNRFIRGCRKKEHPITLVFSEEYHDTLNYLIRARQEEAYRAEMLKILQNRDIHNKSALSGMNPWIDENGILRARTRLGKSIDVSWTTKFPIILEKDDPLTFLIVRELHERLHHAGTNVTFAHLRSSYWVQGARELIRKVEHSCAHCVKLKAKPVQPQMAELPTYRVDGAGKIFTNISIDFAGPFLTKQGRGKVRMKRYLCLFTCLHCRAVHLELVSDMSTQAFLLALSRMIDRRGLPKLIYTDQGSNFIGARRELHEFFLILDENIIAAKTAPDGIKWNFNPPASPHFSGVHEVMIKAAKRAISQILTSSDVTDEELRTAFCGAEGLLNSRPLTYQSAHQDDFVPLTPNNFITGKMDVGLVPKGKITCVDDLRYRWRKVQDLTDQIWSRWLQEWITGLGPRKKWKNTTGEIRQDDVVLVMDPDLPRKRWIMGRVIKVYPGSDGIVRVADVKVKDTVMKRPAVKLCPLRWT